MRIYLSGGMEFTLDLGIGWREWLTNELKKIGHSALDPTKLEEDKNLSTPLQRYLTDLKLQGQLDKVREIGRMSLFRKDMHAIQLSDFLVVLYDESVQRGAGTLSEAWEAFREGRPVYLVSEFSLDKIPTWLIAETTEVFSGFEDFLSYIQDHDRVSKDIENAKRVRDEVLHGVY